LGAGGGEEEEATTHCSGHRPPWLTSIPTGSILHGRGSAASARALVDGRVASSPCASSSWSCVRQRRPVVEVARQGKGRRRDGAAAEY
jgi:hypothetical protein